MRKIVGTCTKEELDSFNLIRTKVETANQALAMKVEDPSQQDQFVKTVLDVLAEYKWLERDWWNDKMKRFGITNGKDLHIDFFTGDLFLNE